MRILISALLLLAPLAASAQFKTSYSSIEDSEDVTAFKEHVSFLSSAALEGRKAGSEGEKEAAAYVGTFLADHGVDVLSGAEGELFGIRQESGDTLTSRNVVAFIPGYDKTLKGHYIVVGARLDNLGVHTTNVDGSPVETVYYGANGNASGLAMLLQLATRLNTNRVLLKRSVLLVAFGSSLPDNAGSWYFLNRSFADVANIDAMVNLDMVGTGSRGFYAYTASNADLSTLHKTISGTLQPIQAKLVSYEPVKSDNRMFYDKKIPAVMFTTGMYPEYNTGKDTASIIDYEDMEREMEYIYNFTLMMANSDKIDFDVTEERKYVYRGSGGVVPYYECDWKPTFLGSNDPTVFLQKWVYVYLKYPRKAVEEGIQGRVLVDFIIDEKGKVTDVKVAKGVHELLDEEAVRVIKASPDWKPGRVRGEKVRSEMSLYVEFRLEKKKK